MQMFSGIDIAGLMGSMGGMMGGEGGIFGMTLA